MARRHFTVGEVERMIPSLERIFTQALQLRAALRTQEQRLERGGVKVTREWFEGDQAVTPANESGRPVTTKAATTKAVATESAADGAGLRHAKLMFRAYWEALGETLAEVERLGGEIKDLEQGLVDFPARRGAEDVYLCWKFGEQQLQHWHTLNSGFGGRRPVDDLIAREPPGLD